MLFDKRSIFLYGFSASDLSVAAALRSAKRLVVVEAPAGCGKTFQGAEYAREVAEQISPGRVLILTHTNAASDVFAERTRGLGRRIEIRTIDSLICDIASAYHLALGLPPDASSWARKSGAGGFSALANKWRCCLNMRRSSPVPSHSDTQSLCVMSTRTLVLASMP